MATTAYVRDDNAALTVSPTKRFDGFTEDELAHLAARAMLPEGVVLEAARRTVDLFHEHWQAEKKNLPLSEAVTKAVEAHFRNVPIGRTVQSSPCRA